MLIKPQQLRAFPLVACQLLAGCTYNCKIVESHVFNAKGQQVSIKNEEQCDHLSAGEIAVMPLAVPLLPVLGIYYVVYKANNNCLGFHYYIEGHDYCVGENFVQEVNK